jgi:cellulose synthase/poly-beta-1,6-N-acetylglucosamine synthase-like glycosyltransferase
MIEETLLAIWGAWTLLILVAAFRVLGFSGARRRQEKRWGKGAAKQRPVALVVSVKGFDLQSTPRFFDTIFDQDYRDYRVIACFESWDDPIAQWLCEHLELGPDRRVWTHPDSTGGLRSVTLACGGISTDEGQKVHNQRAAFADLAPHDSIVAFADADILLGRDWLARLVAPINCGSHEVCTTYRWLVPKRPTLPNQLACVINAAITTQGGNELTNILWGGSMALSREVFDDIDVPELLAGSLNDDLRISKAARASGRKVGFVRSLILPTPIDFDWRGFLEFARRQYTQFKIFSPILYFATNVVLGFYMLGLASIVAAIVYGYFLAWVPVAVSYVIDQFRALARQQIYLSLFKDKGIRQKLFATSWLEHMFSPFWISLNWLLLASTWTQRRLTWAGVRYHIVSKSETRVLGRVPASNVLPAGAPGLAMIRALHDLAPERPMASPLPAATPVSEMPSKLAKEPAPILVEGAIEPLVATEPAIAPATSIPVTESVPPAHFGPFAPVPQLTKPHPPKRRGAAAPLSTKPPGSVPRPVAALRKTQLPAAALFSSAPVRKAPLPAPKVTATPATPAPFAARPTPLPHLRRGLPPLSRAATTHPRLANDTRGGIHPRAVNGPVSSAVAALRKTRLPFKAARPVPRPLAAPPRPTEASPPRPAPPAAETPPTTVARSTKPLPHPSLASRRPGPGTLSGSGHALRATPARSSRTRPSPRAAGALFARPVSRGPSARP